MTTIYGIKNCDTMKKAFRWLDEAGVEYDFHDYKKQGIDEDVVTRAIAEHGWETIINRRGTTWRKLDEDLKNAVTAETALTLSAENPSILKRPILVHGDQVLVGFDEEKYQEIF